MASHLKVNIFNLPIICTNRTKMFNQIFSEIIRNIIGNNLVDSDVSPKFEENCSQSEK